MTSKRSDMEFLELRRKGCEAIGWTEVSVEQWCCVGYPPDSPRTHPVQLRKLPALESDNGRALDALVKWCVDTGRCWTLESLHDGGFRCCVSPCMTSRHDFDGETPALAVVKAIIAASAKDQSKGCSK